MSDRQESRALCLTQTILNVWYGRIKLLFSISVKSDVSEKVTKIDCAYVSFCYDIKLEESGNAVNVCNVY